MKIYKTKLILCFILIHGSIAQTLAEAGHKLTVLGTIPKHYNRAKYTYIHIDSSAQYDEDLSSSLVNKDEPTCTSFNKIMLNTLPSKYEGIFTYPQSSRF